MALSNGLGQFHTLPPLAYNNAHIVAGDFNGDGRPDLVVAIKNQMLFLPGDGDGTFGGTHTIDTFATTYSLAAADLNSDGNLDLLVATSTNVTVMLGNGDGTFQTPLPTNVNTGSSIIVADFNRDGIPDFAILGPIGASPSLEVLLGKGDGTFRAPLTTSVTGAASFAVGNFTGHAIPDVVVTTVSNIQVLVGKGGGTFTFGPSTNFAPGPLVAGDLNGDGKSDLAMFAGGGLSILLNSCNGSFSVRSSAYQIHSAIFPSAPVLGQFRKQAPPDVILGGLYYRNLGTGRFADPQLYPAPFPSYAYPTAAGLAAGDFTGDGKTDLIAVGGEGTTNLAVAVFPGDGRGGFGAYIETSIGTFSSNAVLFGIVTGDFNNDGKLDVALTVYDTTAQWLVVLLGNGAGGFATPAMTPLTTAGYMATGDFNNDGNLDLAVFDSTGISIFLGNGDGTFSLKTTLTGYPNTNQLIATDLNGDGNLDLVTPNDVYLGNTDGTFRYTFTLNTNQG